MEIKYYIGMNEVSMSAFEDAEKQAIKDGRTIKSSSMVDTYPTYTLENGTIIRGDKNGGFNEMVDGKPGKKWDLGTMNEWVQGESTNQGKGMFFIPE
ncbi:MAG: hypothetical protein HDQ87_06865 [Clostridia bacterium]|nr:hypothetical protein [Clostridia bacterium]